MPNRPTVRFAPSPTGYLHIGNLRTALFNWLYAKVEGREGTFILRYDDTDRERSKPEYAEVIATDLEWIGIRPDVVVRQSDRLELYRAAAARLREAGLLYPCYETPDELETKRKRLLARGLPPVYGREALRLSAEDRARLEAEGRRPYWRFLLPNFDGEPFAQQRTEIHWQDLVLGEQTVDLASLSDPVLIRADGNELYTFTSVVDDGDMGVTHVIRGGDHITNTGVQIALLQALGYEVPTFGHHNLLTTIDGESLSKRSGALSLRSLRGAGVQPMAVASLAVLTGMSGSIEAASNLPELGARLDLSTVSASASKFDPAELDRLSAEITHRLEPGDIRTELEAIGVPPESVEAFWHAVRANCVKMADAAEWRAVVFGGSPVRPDLGEDDRQFTREAFDLLPDEPWDERTWKGWADAVKAATGRKGKALFMPLRIALTGLDHGPELASLLPLIGRERTLKRRP
ncbi:glutamate--tRNA ligase [Aureimonas leprariae]|uniref:Glutamate--tRNA ligase n=1 Tax=Plantimonas leprariae TaxID=2615207 RepID=A0A7V7TXG3_9HYPH|nr:glutamate--tRNA ligase [Aureimonas leprariae]KAB0680837.1 glutamate--tRNA ligase [Aureimonas leprariae]